ncbi:MAG: DUF871 domain-containing protein [Solobacterium sp.]|nr:DUF871 domain-containing protein [Solobacterium sp.]
MKQLGISVFPEHTTKEKAYEYMRLAGSLGFKRVFTCFLSLTGTREETIRSFKEFTTVAHEAGLTVSADTNPDVFQKMGATPYDLSVFKEIGLDIIRLDGHFGETEDIALTHNREGIRIEYNASGTIAIENMIRMGADEENMCFCSNFFPQRHTGMGLDRYIELTSRYKKAGMRIASFVSSQNENTFGPWPVYDGLPTLEMHRDLPIDLQLRHLNAVNLCQDILVGNCFATEAELRLMAETDLSRINMRITFAEGASEAEKEIVFWDRHAHRDDCNDLIIRSSWPRVVFKGVSIPARKRPSATVHRGDVLVVNDNLEHYRGEVWIVLKDLEVSDQYNLVGRIPDEEQILLDWIRPRGLFGFLNG